MYYAYSAGRIAPKAPNVARRVALTLRSTWQQFQGAQANGLEAMVLEMLAVVLLALVKVLAEGSLREQVKARAKDKGKARAEITRSGRLAKTAIIG